MTTHFLAECLSTPWALQPERMRAYAVVLANRYARGAQRAGGMDEDDHGAPLKADAQVAAQRAGNARSGAIAVVPVYGTIMQRSSQINICEGGTSCQSISKQMREANADESISSIILDVDSPGGSVYGVAELAAEIRSSAKPVYGIANSLSASAGYWLLSQCVEAYVTPGGEVGSIGVWQAHEDWSKAIDEAGVNVTLISAGKYKTEGHPYGPLSDETKAFMQQRTDEYYAAFTRDVAKGRKVGVDAVRGGMGQGRVLGADEAKAQGMVDGTMTFDQLVKHVQRATGTSTNRRSAQQQAATRLQLLSLG